MNNIGEKIKQFREEKRITRQAVAEKLGITPDAVTKYENAFVTPPLDKIVAIAEFLNVSYIDLIGYDGRVPTDRAVLDAVAFQYRYEHCTSLVVKLDCVKNFSFGAWEDEESGVFMTMTEKREEDGEIKFVDKKIKFQTATQFVKAVESAINRALSETVTFKTAFKKVIDEL